MIDVMSIWQRLGYKLRNAGLRESVHLAYLSVAEAAMMRLERWFPSVYFSPRAIQIEVTTRCNLKCTHCEISYWSEVAADMRLPEFQKVIDHLPKLNRLQLTGIGEPLMNRDFYKIVELAKSRGIRIEMVDNFTMMTEKAARRVIDLGIDRLCLSLDGATKETFEKVRVGSNFDKVIRNARRLVDLKRQLGKRKPELSANFIVSAQSYKEAPAIVQLVHDIGFDQMIFDRVVTFDKTENLSTKSIAEEMERSLAQAHELARRLGVHIRSVHFDRSIPVQQCTRIQDSLFVTRDGFIHPCCMTTQTGDRQAQNRRSLGNLISESIEEVKRGDAYLNLRNKMSQGILPHACHRCPLYSGKPDIAGRDQEAALQSSPYLSPVNFVSRNTRSEHSTLK